MSGPQELGAAWWQERYAGGEGAGLRQAGPALLAAVQGVPPGRALDAGCGTGGDARELAARGWQVTAVDVSPAALQRGRAATGPDLGDRIDWVCADLATWEPGVPGFDLVTSHYVHAPGPPEVLLGRLASWVGPGGSLLVVGHADGHHSHGEARPQGAQLLAEQVLAVLAGDGWDVLVAEPRTSVLQRPDGTGVVELDDVVVHARRRVAGR